MKSNFDRDNYALFAGLQENLCKPLVKINISWAAGASKQEPNGKPYLKQYS